MLEVNNLFIKYNQSIIIKNSSMRFNSGTITAIIGESGSGKTSILEILALEKEVDSVEYTSSFSENKTILKRYRISYLKQGNNCINHLTCFENLNLISKLVNKRLTALDISNILKKVNLDINIKTYPNNLSGGEKQRFAIALALVKDADIIICDEITASLDEENSKLIMDILKDLAHTDKKTIIISSHNEDAFSQCDNIYKIENREIHEVKKSDLIALDEQSNIIKMIPIKLRTIYTYVISKIKKQKLLFISYLMLVSLIVSIVGIGFFAGQQFSTQLSKMLNIINKDQSFVMSTMQTSGHRGYSPTNLAITEDQLAQIKNIDGIQELTPYLSFDWPDYINIIDNVDQQKKLTGITINVITNGMQENQISLSNTIQFSIFSNYHQDEMDYSCIQVNKNVDGIYLRHDIANMLGISDTLSNTEVQFDIYVPIVTKITNSNYRIPIYAMTTITKPVRGILHPSYSHYQGNAMYLSYEEMAQILEVEKSKYSTPIGYETYTPNIYSIFTKSNTSIESIQTQLSQIDPHLYVYNSGISLNESMTPFLENEQYFNIYSIILFVVAIIISLIYSVLSHRDYKEETQLLKTWGTIKKENFKLLIMEIIIKSLIIFIISILLYGLIMIILHNSQKLMINTLNIELIGISIALISGLSLITAFSSHLSLIIINRRTFKK